MNTNVYQDFQICVSVPLTLGKSHLFLKFDSIVRFQTPRDYFDDLTVSLKAKPELLLNTINLIFLSEWLVVAVRFMVKIDLFINNVTLTIKTL